MPPEKPEFERLLENISDAVLLTTGDGTVTYASPTTARILGYDPGEVVGGKLWRWNHPDEIARTIEVFADLARRPGHQITVELRVRHKNGSWRWIETVRKNMLHDPAVRAIVVNYRDITERKEADEALRESESRHQAALDGALDAIITIGADGAIVEFNPAAEAMFGYRRSEALGRDMCDLLIPPALRERHRRGFALHLVTGETRVIGRRVEFTALRRGGIEFPIELAVIRVPTDPPMFTAFIRDLSARRRAEAEREQRARTARFLAEVTLEFAGHQDPTSLFAVIARRCTEVLGEWCAIFSHTPGDPWLTVEALHHADERKRNRILEVLAAQPMPASDPTVARLLKARQPLVLSRDGAETQRLIRDMPAVAAGFTELGVAGALAVPIYIDGGAAGIFIIGREAAGAWGEEDLRLASLIADRAGVAIHNARLRESERAARREIERAADRTTRLQRVTAALSEALTVGQVVDVILDHGMAALGASAGSVSLLSHDGVALELVRAVGYPQSVVDAWQGATLSSPARGVAADAIRGGQPLFLESKSALIARYARALEPPVILPFDGGRAIVPLMSGGHALGVLSLLFPTPRDFPEDERAFIQTLARQCAQALDRARHFEHEHTVAETLQRSLLPAHLPDVPGIQFAAAYLPAAPEAKIGGDWYDALALPDGNLGVVIGDVAGHDLLAASTMSRLRNAARAFAMDLVQPADLVRRLSILLERSEMATLIYLILNPVEETVTFANAGHLPPLLIPPAGGARFLPGASPPLYRTGAEYHQDTTRISAGSTILLYTDGLVEDRGKQTLDDGLVRLRALAERASGAGVRAMVEQIAADARQSTRQDDIAVLGVTLAALDPHALHLRPPAVPESAPVVRRALRRWLQAAHTDPSEIQDIVTACGEACNNAIEHAYDAAPASFSVEAVRAGDRIEITVRDRGHWRPARSGGSGGGLGLEVMRRLMDAVDVERGSDGTTVRLQRRLTAAALT